MFKKIPKSVFFVISVILLLGAFIILTKYKIPANSKNNYSVQILPVETVAFNPAKYSGYIGIKGTVNKVVDDKMFLLGCQDACVSVPVKYEGQTPGLGQNVTIYGQLSQQNGKYVFMAHTLKLTIQYEK